MNKPHWFRTMLTGKDNFSIDIGRVLLALLILAYMAFQAWQMREHADLFNPLTFGSGAAALLGGAAILFSWKAKTEPGA